MMPRYRFAEGRSPLLNSTSRLLNGKYSAVPPQAGGESRHAHLSYAVRMSGSPLSPQEILAAAAANAELGPEYSDEVVTSFPG